MTQIIKVIVLPNGETKIETKGIVGSACRQASGYLERALGTRVQEQLTAEFHQTTPQQQSLRQSGSA